MKQLFFLSVIAFLLAACAGNSSNTETNGTDTVATAPPATADNNKTSLDWAGTYKGTVPCADCEGIETTISIDTDSNYTLTLNYLGKKDAVMVEKKGTFTWNDAGSTIILSGISDGATHYLVGENKLIQLDLSGNRITGELAARYELAKQ